MQIQSGQTVPLTRFSSTFLSFHEMNKKYEIFFIFSISLYKCKLYRNTITIINLKKCVVLQVNDAAVRIRIVIFASKVQLFYTQITEQTGGGREDMRGVPRHLSDFVFWLTVIWSGAPTDSFAKVSLFTPTFVSFRHYLPTPVFLC